MNKWRYTGALATLYCVLVFWDIVLDLAGNFLELTNALQVYHYEQEQESICIKWLTRQMFLNFSIKPSFSVFIWLSFTLNLCHSVSLQKDTTTTAARGTEYTQTRTHTHTHTHTHTVWTTYTGRCYTHSLAGLDEWA